MSKQQARFYLGFVQDSVDTDLNRYVHGCSPSESERRPPKPILLKHPKEAKQDKFHGAWRSVGRVGVWQMQRNCEQPKGHVACGRVVFLGILSSSRPSPIKESLSLSPAE